MNKRDLVLLGGGHTHVLLIKALAMNPIAEVRITLISERALTPYSGMLPGYVAGHYALAQTNIDLNSLCRKAGVRWIQATSYGVAADRQRVHLRDQPDVDYDVLSIDIGSTPNLRIPGAREFAVGVKPIAEFQHKWQTLLTSLELNDAVDRATSSLDWGVIGAGAGGVELVLAMAHRLRKQQHLKFHLIYRGEQILPGYPARVVQHVEQALHDYGVLLHPQFPVSSVQANGVVSESGQGIGLDTSIWCTGALGAGWLSNSDLATTKHNFIEVNNHLQSLSHPNVYAVGDIAENVDDPRPKAGVYAVRQAPFLERNLRHHFAGKPLVKTKLQSQFLSLLALGDTVAVGSRNGLTLKGRWVWRWKDAIDGKFMRQFDDLKLMPMTLDSGSQMSEEEQHCGGCASKLGPTLLASNLASLEGATGHRVEDAALWQATPGQLSVQTIDGFRSFTSDESRFAQVSVLHALSDLFAMGATPLHIQAWINLAFSGPVLQQRDHLRMLQGIKSIIEPHGVTLVGGHSSQGAESHLGIVANGEVSPNLQWSKDGARIGDAIVMSKALGSGVVLAADMQGAADANAVDAVMQSMLESNLKAMQLLQQYTPSAVTDITGFGLLGHLLEMLDSASSRSQGDLVAALDFASIPLIPGALALAESGWRSSLYAELEGYLSRCSFDGVIASSDQSLGLNPRSLARQSLLIDPQTSGGLLACLALADAQKLQQECASFTLIGKITERNNLSNPLQIRFE